MLGSETQPSSLRANATLLCSVPGLPTLPLLPAALQNVVADTGLGCWDVTQTQWKQIGPDSTIAFSSLS